MLVRSEDREKLGDVLAGVEPGLSIFLKNP